MPTPDICEHLRKKIQTHQAAITKLREELEVYVGTPDSQENDSEEIKNEIAEHRRAIEELRIGMESQKC
jgi:chromosome segregation ATPase